MHGPVAITNSIVGKRQLSLSPCTDYTAETGNEFALHLRLGRAGVKVDANRPKEIQLMQGTRIIRRGGCRDI